MPSLHCSDFVTLGAEGYELFKGPVDWIPHRFRGEGIADFAEGEVTVNLANFAAKNAFGDLDVVGEGGGAHGCKCRATSED